MDSLTYLIANGFIKSTFKHPTDDYFYEYVYRCKTKEGCTLRVRLFEKSDTIDVILFDDEKKKELRLLIPSFDYNNKEKVEELKFILENADQTQTDRI